MEDSTWMVFDCEELMGVRKSTASAEGYSQLSGEVTLDTGAFISKKLYGYNADK